jgi:hypothetical protein
VGIVEDGRKRGGIIPAGSSIGAEFRNLKLYLPLCHQLGFHQPLAQVQEDPPPEPLYEEKYISRKVDEEMVVSAKVGEKAAEKVAELKRHLRSMGYSTSHVEILSKSVEFAFEHLSEFTKKFEQKPDPLWEWASRPIKGPKVRAAEEIDRVVY